MVIEFRATTTNGMPQTLEVACDYLTNLTVRRAGLLSHHTGTIYTIEDLDIRSCPINSSIPSVEGTVVVPQNTLIDNMVGLASDAALPETNIAKSGNCISSSRLLSSRVHMIPAGCAHSEASVTAGVTAFVPMRG